MREIRFRAWDSNKMVVPACIGDYGEWYETGRDYENGRGIKDGLMQFTGIKDKNGKDIFEGDVLEFADKWEWYRTKYGIRMLGAQPEKRKELQEEYDKEPMERRVIEMPECYEWLISSEIQTYWHVIGNIHENPELIEREAKI